jgi:hypothetical protein
LVVGEFRSKNFKSNLLTVGIGGGVHDTKPAAAEPPEDLIFSDGGGVGSQKRLVTRRATGFG